MHEPDFDPSAPSPAPVPEGATEIPPPPSGPLAWGQQIAPWWHTIILVLLFVGMSAMGGLVAKTKHLEGQQVSTYTFTIVYEWVLLAYVWWGLRIRRVRLSSLLGERFKSWGGFARYLIYAAVFWIIAVLFLSGAELLLKHLHIGKTGPAAKAIALAPRNPLEVLLWLLVCITAGICEEFLFRGYLLRQFSSLGGKIWIGVLLSSLVFGVSHGYEGIASMIVIGFYGVLFCLLLLKTKSTIPGMIAHAWHDIFAGLTMAYLIHIHHL